MKIKTINVRTETFELKSSKKKALSDNKHLKNIIVEVYLENNIVGVGSGSPIRLVTKETMDKCERALSPLNIYWLVGLDIRKLAKHCRELKRSMADTPAACCALEIALHDALAKFYNIPLVEMLGRVHKSLPTSVTIDITSTDETIAEAKEYIGKGFKIIKVKIGRSVTEDIERLTFLREAIGYDVNIRTDPNQSYSYYETCRFLKETQKLRLEYIEQPINSDFIDDIRMLPQEVRKKLAVDESLCSEKDAIEMICPSRVCGIFNVKLMKCGGISTAKLIANIAEAADIELLWGCTNESRISISAALHLALASPKTKYLDLDGSFCITNDIVEGGFLLENGYMRTLDLPGLGVESRTLTS